MAFPLKSMIGSAVFAAGLSLFAAEAQSCT